jgi:hypothetical protein
MAQTCGYIDGNPGKEVSTLFLGVLPFKMLKTIIRAAIHVYR